MKITYWYAPIIRDSRSYNIRAKTKKAAEEMREKFGTEGYDTVRKNTVEYSDGFDLLTQCLGEGSVFEEEGYSERDKEMYAKFEAEKAK